MAAVSCVVAASPGTNFMWLGGITGAGLGLLIGVSLPPVYVKMCKDSFMHACMDACMACMYAWMHASMHAYVNRYIDTYIYIYMHAIQTCINTHVHA